MSKVRKNLKRRRNMNKAELIKVIVEKAQITKLNAEKMP